MSLNKFLFKVTSLDKDNNKRVASRHHAVDLGAGAGLLWFPPMVSLDVADSWWPAARFLHDLDVWKVFKVNP